MKLAEGKPKRMRNENFQKRRKGRFIEQMRSDELGNRAVGAVNFFGMARALLTSAGSFRKNGGV